jgi:hypothetical protein
MRGRRARGRNLEPIKGNVEVDVLGPGLHGALDLGERCDLVGQRFGGGHRIAPDGCGSPWLLSWVLRCRVRCPGRAVVDGATHCSCIAVSHVFAVRLTASAALPVGGATETVEQVVSRRKEVQRPNSRTLRTKRSRPSGNARGTTVVAQT